MLSGKCWLEVVSYLSTAKTEITNQKKQQKNVTKMPWPPLSVNNSNSGHSAEQERGKQVLEVPRNDLTPHMFPGRPCHPGQGLPGRGSPRGTWSGGLGGRRGRRGLGRSSCSVYTFVSTPMGRALESCVLKI